jgi:hypothetical protein
VIAITGGVSSTAANIRVAHPSSARAWVANTKAISLVERIIPTIAHWFEIEENLLSIINFGPASFLLISLD